MSIRRLACAAALLTFTAPAAFAADAAAGSQAFAAQCALCHSAAPNDGGGAQGPSLAGILGRKAATHGEFSYSSALRASDLTWNEATLDRFLASPTAVVPGSAMVVAVPSATDRENLIAYFAAVRDGTFRAPPPPPAFGGGARGAAPVSQANADWKNDAPGRVHRIDLDKLPAPYASPSASNFPRVVPKPEGAELKLPPGFTVQVFTTDVTGPRVMRVAPNGDIFVTETQSGRIKVLKPSADGASAASVTIFAQGLVQPMGMQFYPAGNRPEWLYVAEMNRVVRYPFRTGDTAARGVPEVVVPQLSPTGGGHYTRDLVFSPDGRQMFVSVGSNTNVGERMGDKTAAEAAAWDAARGLGAAWGDEENRAAVLVFDVGSNSPGRLWATGLRNCVGLSMQPETGDLWCSVNERDQLGDDLVPDYSTRVPEGSFFGWPWYYMGDNEDPRHAGKRPDLKGKVSKPDVPYQAHSAADALEFYRATSGAAAFPSEYVGDGFAVLHGSWNRAFRTGHKIVRVPIENGVPTGEYVDFMTGFITETGDTWGRPVSATVASDGALLVSDDQVNVIYRIAYRR